MQFYVYIHLLPYSWVSLLCYNPLSSIISFRIGRIFFSYVQTTAIEFALVCMGVNRGGGGGGGE